jgi:hypothetical protein
MCIAGLNLERNTEYVIDKILKRNDYEYCDRCIHDIFILSWFETAV